MDPRYNLHCPILLNFKEPRSSGIIKCFISKKKPIQTACPTPIRSTSSYQSFNRDVPMTATQYASPKFISKKHSLLKFPVKVNHLNCDEYFSNNMSNIPGKLYCPKRPQTAHSIQDLLWAPSMNSTPHPIHNRHFAISHKFFNKSKHILADTSPNACIIAFDASKCLRQIKSDHKPLKAKRVEKEKLIACSKYNSMLSLDKFKQFVTYEGSILYNKAYKLN